jgi:hypothetical protein
MGTGLAVTTATTRDLPGPLQTAPLTLEGGAPCHIDRPGWSRPPPDIRALARRRASVEPSGVDIEFTGFAGDCIITGRFALAAKRLTDQLNAVEAVPLEDVVLDGLDGQRVTTPTFTIDRNELCAVVGSGPRGRRALRIATDRRRLQVQVGPYVVLGRYHGPLGATTLRTFAERDPMVPLTDATIAYVVGGVLEVIDAPTLIINRELAAWYREADEEFEASLVSIGQHAVRTEA